MKVIGAELGASWWIFFSNMRPKSNLSDLKSRDIDLNQMYT
jgi:hypothetical protein